MKIDKNIKLVIAEDDSRDQKTMLHILDQNFPEIDVVATTSSVEETILAIQYHQPQLVLLDIYLKDGLSFDVLKNIPLSSVKIIFMSSYQEHAIEAFQLSAIDYIYKPLDINEFIVAIDKTIEEVNDRSFKDKAAVFFHNLGYDESEKQIVLKGIETDYHCSIKNIVWAESIIKGSRFHFQNRLPLVSNEPLRRYESILQHYNFARCHPMHLININHISYIDALSSSIQMNNGQLVEADNRRKEYLIKKLQLVHNHF